MENQLKEAAVKFKIEALTIKARMYETDDVPKLRSLSGQLGGVQRRWASKLVELLTASVFKDQSVSREKVRDWQQRTFGQALGSGKLRTYAVADRVGGGRSNFSEPSPEVAQRLAKLFAQYRSECYRD